MEVTMNPDRLRSRALPTDTYWLQVDDTAEPGRALAEAREALQVKLLTGAAEVEVHDARQAVKAAEEALKACYEPITVTAMEPPAWETLVAAHPPRRDNDSDDVWDTSTLPREAFLACAPKDWSRQEWEEYLDHKLSPAEREGLYLTAVGVNARVPDPTVPKGWTPTPA
ncbi:hypothetical protein ACIBI0_38430 [Microbispora rosea]|uniref:hypothetical protein n=1 Tax=Microbispora rosea TaxID=58117 RepID=UPI00378ED723